MKTNVTLLLLVFLVGCAHQANLKPLFSGSDTYIMFYDRSDVNICVAKGTATEQRNNIYEERVKLILNTDPNTSECKVIKGSINFGEPGSGGTAKVKCPTSLPMEKSGMYKNDGSPSYYYPLKPYDHI